MIGPNSKLTNTLRENFGFVHKYPKIIKFYQFYVQLYSKFVTWYCFGRKYKAPIDPFRLIYVDPQDVKKKQMDKSDFIFSDVVSEVHDGDWDQKCIAMKELEAYKAFCDRFCKDIPWKETEWYNTTTEELISGTNRWGCESVEEFDDRLYKMQELYENIKQNGYMKQEKLSGISKDPLKRGIHCFWPNRLNEVVINIDRSGGMILHEGRHRMYIAKILDLEKIPVRVKTRHKIWQRERDRFVENGRFNSLNDLHPDLIEGRNHIPPSHLF